MFDLWRAQRFKVKLDRGYRKDAAELRKAGKHEDHEALLSEWASEGTMAEDSVNAIVTRKLIGKANKMDVPIPSYPVHPQEENESWTRSSYTGEYILSGNGRAALRDALRKEKKERFESRARWVALLTGVIGAAIGLVSVMTNFVVRLLGRH